MNQTLLTLENLKIAYPSTRNLPSEKLTWAVNGVSFELNSGQIFALVGESGCGKSTIGKALINLLPSQTKIEGDILFQEESILNYNQEQLRQYRGEFVSLIFQDHLTRLDPLMTIGDHFLETLKAHKPDLSLQLAKEKAIETLNAVKIPESRWSQYPHEFSGGMRQRVAIALALVLEPKLIIADEPTTSLDVTVASEILHELTRLCKVMKMGLLLISHDLAMVSKYCDKVGIMYKGKMVEVGAVTSIFRDPQHEYTQSLLESAFHLHKRHHENKISFSSSMPMFMTGSVYEHYNDPHLSWNNSLPLLEIKNLQKFYTLEGNLLEQIFKKETEVIKAVDNVNLEIYEGQILGLVGESGCGKSTLSRIITQLIKPTQGKVFFLGKDLDSLGRKKNYSFRREISMIFQDPSACLNPSMTVGEGIADPLLIHKIGTKKEARNKVAKMLTKVGLTPVNNFFYRYPKELSGGQQQRVAIARALVTRPKLIICDEPVSMLDASIQTQVLELMLDLKAEYNLTYLFITHDLSVARFLCDRIAVMNAGKIVEIGDTENIFTNPQHDYTKTLLNAAPILKTTNDKSFNQ